MRGCWWLACIVLAGCGRYADFTLPVLSGAKDDPNSFLFAEQPEPVLRRGAAGEWDSHDALNPSVVKHDGVYYNFYSGYDGSTWRTGLATSADGVAWPKQGVVLSPDAATWEGSYWAANGAALFHEGRFWYWYQAGAKETPRLALARSADGRRWTKEPAPVLELGPRGSWDERGAGDPYVIRIEPWFYLYYLGQDRARRQRLGIARSKDGVKWEKLRANPLLELGGYGEFDENGLGEPAVWQGQGWYWMLYTGRDRGERRRLGLARSRDGVSWRKLARVIGGGASWNSQVICDPTVLVEGGRVRVWFGGGDVAHPVENIDGQIGVGEWKAEAR